MTKDPLKIALLAIHEATLRQAAIIENLPPPPDDRLDFMLSKILTEDLGNLNNVILDALEGLSCAGIGNLDDDSDTFVERFDLALRRVKERGSDFWKGPQVVHS